MRNWLRLFVQLFVIVALACWAFSYLLPLPARGNLLMGLIPGLLVASLVSVFYRPVTIAIANTAEATRDRAVDSALASIGFERTGNVNGMTIFKKPGAFGPFAPRISVRESVETCEISGPYWEICEFRTAMRKQTDDARYH